MNKQHIIENAQRTYHDHGMRYNLHLDIGPYTLSLGVGDGMYSNPRCGGFEIDGYTELEGAILDSEGNLMGHKEIKQKFGPYVASMCEGYGFGDDSSVGEMLGNSSTIMPYITWHEVVIVANIIDTAASALP